jgi:uncharacterized protein (TIGR04222 family)
MAVKVARRKLEDAGGRAPDPDHLDRYDVAMLNGGEELAITVALARLRDSGAIHAGDKLVRELAAAQNFNLKNLSHKRVADLGVKFQAAKAGPLPAGAHPVERSVYEAVPSSGQDLAAVRAACASSPALIEPRDRLTALGLFRDERQTAVMKGHWLWFVPVAALGLARLVAGLSRGDPIGFLVLELIVTGMAMVAASRVSAKTRSGKRLLSELRTRPELKDASKGRPASAPVELGMLLALFGAQVLWDTDPSLALALAIPKPGSAGGGGDGGCGGCGDAAAAGDERLAAASRPGAGRRLA